MDSDAKSIKLTRVLGQGYVIYGGVLTSETCTKIFRSLTEEICDYILGSASIHSIDFRSMTRMICDPNLRSKMGVSANNIWRGGNSRESKLLKKSGKVSLYLNPEVRDYIWRNELVRTILADIYKTRIIAFSTGIDHCIYKPCMAEESIPTLDCSINHPLGKSTALVNPFHYVSMVCVRSSNSDNGAGLKLLTNFDIYFNLIVDMIGPCGDHPIVKQKGDKQTIMVGLKVDEINASLEQIVCNLEREGYVGPLSPFKPLKWESVNVSSGQMIVFDCRIPYITEKNRDPVPVVYCPVSLRPIEGHWYGSKEHKQLVESMTNGHVGDWRKRMVKKCNIEEYTWRVSSNVYTIDRFTNCKLSNAEKKLFGLTKYKSLCN